MVSHGPANAVRTITHHHDRRGPARVGGSGIAAMQQVRRPLIHSGLLQGDVTSFITWK